jgi:catechol 2,3-dioxygenase-like lactoylglutathione lyase family enzyme
MPSVPAEDQLVLELFVRDFERALGFYTTLGFAVERQEDGFAVLRWDGCGFLLQMMRKLGELPARPFANLRIMVDDVDSYWQRCMDLGTPVFVPIGDRDYGLRDFIVCDPDGFGLRFASLIERES